MIGNSGKKTIGLILENIYTDFAEEIFQNVLSGIRQHKNYNLVVISGQFDLTKDKDERHHKYLTTYNAIYQLQKRCRFDGLIICLGSMTDPSREMVDRRFKTDIDIPIVFSVCEINGYTSVNYDNAQGIKEAVDCLINVHGFSRFCMMGGRADNFDSLQRKDLYIQALRDGGVTFEERNYVPTEMSVNTQEEAKILLDRNPDVQAIFCVNDSVAVGLYEEMARRRLVPGKDIMVFGFDNTKMAGRMIPTLSSIGAGEATLGRKSLELLISMMNGERVESVKIPTCLYGRESFPYEMYEYTTMEMHNIDTDFIYRMFDDCFYRYRYEHISRESVNLKRLFKEFISMILLGLKQQYMSVEDFHEAKDMIRIFFENGAMDYTDAGKLVKSIMRLQASVNIAQSANSAGSNVYINRLFTYMRDCAIASQADYIVSSNSDLVAYRQNLQDYMVDITDFSGLGDADFEEIIGRFNKLGLKNSALFFFDNPVPFKEGDEDIFPEYIRLCAVTKEGELYVLPKERRAGRLGEMYHRVELPEKCKESATFPIFYRQNYYGFLVCQMDKSITNTGEFIAGQIGRAIYMAGEKMD
ncbi:MAG: substrate-binding domain-containing protein [Clostridiales bacterium]|nr:substrate-binding domain-containing protein [Clostridiales bacterium]